VNNLPKILLMVGAVVLAFLLGVVVGRHHQADIPTEPSTSSVQISTQAPPAPAPSVATKLPTVPEAPRPAPVIKVDPKAQVNDDAAAVGMTTRDEPETGTSPPPEPDAEPKSEPAPN
jgi:hypothetical protein